MELLVETEIEDRRTRFLLFETLRLKGLLELPQTQSTNFSLLTAFDLTMQDIQEASPIAERLIRNGLAYLCTWGDLCETWHDTVDRIDVDLNLPTAYTDGVVMTTWHDKDSLEKALWFFTYCASPTDGFSATCGDYIVACSPAYSDRVKKYFAEEFQ